MKRSTKILTGTTVAILITTASISMVSAHGGFNRSGGCDGYGGPQQWQQGLGPMMHQRGKMWGFGSGMQQFVQQRLDQAKYQLRITEEQEPAWQEFTAEIENGVSTMRDHMQQRRTQKSLAERVQHMRDKSDQMSQMASAVEKMYQTLTPEQQKIADEFTPMRMRGF